MRTFLLGVVSAMCCATACRQQTPATEKFGAELTLQSETPISQVLAEPERFLGEKVLVRGEVLEVCAQADCWMNLASDQAGQEIRVKVQYGVIVFPLAAKGKTARVEGEVYKIELTAEQARGYLAHLAEERGLAFDSSSVAGPMTIYQLKGWGAEIGGEQSAQAAQVILP